MDNVNPTFTSLAGAGIECGSARRPVAPAAQTLSQPSEKQHSASSAATCSEDMNSSPTLAAGAGPLCEGFDRRLSDDELSLAGYIGAYSPPDRPPDGSGAAL